MTDPIKYFSEKYEFNISEISELVIGAKYCAVMLTNGEMGVSANLENRFDFNINELKNIDFSNYKHRLIINAYLNAKINSDKKKSEKNEDILEVIDFEKYDNITMVGFFKPVVRKLDKMGIDINIFDFAHSEERIIKQDLLSDYASKSDCIILTATTIANNSFCNILKKSKDNCDIFILGPSTIMDSDMFNYRNVSALFGTKFHQNDYESLEIINSNEGTRHFIKLADKISSIKK